MTTPTRRRGSDLARVGAQQLSAVVVAFLIVGVVLIVSGYDVVEVYKTLAGSVVTDPWGTVRWATPLILTGLSTAVAFRARIWNIGMDGQLYIGALFGSWTALHLAPHTSSVLGVILVLLASAIGGAAWALPPALLRARFGVPEIITTILFIEIASLLVSYMVLGPMRGKGSFGASLSSDPIEERFWLPRIVGDQTATVGIFVAVALSVLAAVYLYRSTQGFELATFGDNRSFSSYVGMNNGWVFTRTMMISGALSGLAGGVEILGSIHRLPSNLAAGLGFQGIAVSLVANNNPIGIVVSALFFGALRTGGTTLQRLTETPRDVVDIISAIVILVITASIGSRILQVIGRWSGRSRSTSQVEQR